MDRLALYVRAQVLDLTRRHLPPGPAMRSVLSADSFAKLAVHVGELNSLLQDILRDGMEQGYLPEADVEGLAQLIHGSLTASASAARASRAPRNWRRTSPVRCASSRLASAQSSTTTGAPSVPPRHAEPHRPTPLPPPIESGGLHLKGRCEGAYLHTQRKPRRAFVREPAPPSSDHPRPHWTDHPASVMG